MWTACSSRFTLLSVLQGVLLLLVLLVVAPRLEASSTHPRPHFFLGRTRAPISATNLISIRGGHVPARRITTIDVLQDPNPAPNIDDLEDEVTDEELDQVLDVLIGTHGGIIIHRFLPQRRWLWRQWYATVFYHTMKSALRNMLGALVVCAFLRNMTHGDWRVWDFPDSTGVISPMLARLVMIGSIWKSLMGLTTFLLTFFVAQAYSFWQKVYEIGRSLQGRINDINLLLATHVKRKKDGTYTPEAYRFLEEVASVLRVYHILMWATHARRFRILLTDRGFARMVTRGIMSIHEKETMEMQMGLTKTERHYVLLEWVIYKCHQAQKKGILEGGAGLEHVLLDKACILRSMSSQVSHKVNGRMPLAYAHFVQILVDSFLFCAPLAQYADLGIFSVISMGIFTLFYLGLMDLAKVFLDPLGNEDYMDGCGNMDLTVLIRESNGASRLWMKAADRKSVV